jgi:hypothetical protein
MSHVIAVKSVRRPGPTRAHGLCVVVVAAVVAAVVVAVVAAVVVEP